MNKTLHKLAAHCAPPAPGVLRALVPGVLCGWGCAGLLALGHPWLAGALALAAAAVAGQWWKPSFWAESWKGRGWLLPTLALGAVLAAVMLHIETEPLEVLTGRDTLLGGREGCWLYLYGLQALLPSLREAGEGVQEQYHALYQALYADPEELLSLWAEG